jgi:hypothetical protein
MTDPVFALPDTYAGLAGVSWPNQRSGDPRYKVGSAYFLGCALNFFTQPEQQNA